MATHIKHTPMLEGEDSIFFNKQIKKTSKKKISKEEKDRIITLYKKVMENSKNTNLFDI